MAPACKERDSQWQNICHGHRQKSTLEIGISLNAEHFIAELLLKALPLPGAQNLLLFHPARSPQPWAAFPIPGQLFPSFPIPFPALDNLSYPFPSLPQPFPGFPIPFPSPFPSPSPSFSHPIPSPAALSCSKGHFHGAKSDGNGQTPQTAGAKAVAARGSVFYLSGDTSSLIIQPLTGKLLIPAPLPRTDSHKSFIPLSPCMGIQNLWAWTATQSSQQQGEFLLLHIRKLFGC